MESVAGKTDRYADLLRGVALYPIHKTRYIKACVQTNRLQDAGIALIGAVTIGISAIAVERKLDFLKRAQRTPGSVVAVTHGTAHVQISFAAPSGEKIEIPGNGWISHHVGDQVEVLFLSDDPRATAELNEPGAIWYLPAGFGALGAVFFCAGLFGVFRKQ